MPRPKILVSADSEIIEHIAAVHGHNRNLIGDVTGLSPTTIARAFAGEPISIEAAMEICVALNGVLLGMLFRVPYPYNVPLGVPNNSAGDVADTVP